MEKGIKDDSQVFNLTKKKKKDTVCRTKCTFEREDDGLSWDWGEGHKNEVLQ